jgi:TolA-binding protein
MRKQSPARIALLVVMVGLSACSSVQRREQDEQEKQKLEKTETELSDARNQITSLNARIEALETKLSSMNDKVDQTRTSVDNMMNVKRPTDSGVEAPPAHARGERIEPETTPKDPEAGFAHDSAISSFRQAMILFEAQKFPEAILAFSSFLEAYPDHALAGSAQYYVGESYFRQKEYRLANQEFNRVLTSYDRSAHVSDTLERLAETSDLLRKPEEAARNRQLLSSLFPQSPAAKAASEPKAEPAEETGEAPEEKAASPQTESDDETPPTAPVPGEKKQEKE